MDSAIIWVTAIVVTAGTYLMRIAGSLPGFRRLAQAKWVRNVPLAVFFVLAVYALAPSAGTLPAPATLLAAGLVLGLSFLRAPLAVRIMLGTLAYGILSTFVFT